MCVSEYGKTEKNRLCNSKVKADTKSTFISFLDNRPITVSKRLYPT